MIQDPSNLGEAANEQKDQPAPLAGANDPAGELLVPLETPARISEPSLAQTGGAKYNASGSPSRVPSSSAVDSSASRSRKKNFECLPPGLMLGKCRIERLIGHGGMGAVYFARHLALDVPVAVKVLIPDPGKDMDELVQRFVQEARLASRIHHPNVVQMLDVGTDEATGIDYIVQEYVGGGSVSDLMKKCVIEECYALDIVISVASALVAAAKVNIIHRDIKPENIMLAEDGEAKLADLGIAKKCNGEDGGMTLSHVMMGTPFYVSPEQARDTKRVDARADIYSLGATLYHMLCGQPPYPGKTTFEVLSNLIAEPVPNPLLKRPDISPAMAAVTMRMMAKDPEDRPATAAQLLEELTAVRRTIAKARHPMLSHLKHIQDHWRRGGWRPVVALAATLLLLGLAATAGSWGWNRPPKRPVTNLNSVSVPDPGRSQEVAEKPKEIRVPIGCRVKTGTVKEPYSDTGWAQAVIHDATGIELMYIPAGEFLMGSPAEEKDHEIHELQHRVVLTKGFYMGKTEVTQAQWQSVMINNPSNFKGNDLPVEQVNWDDCQSFCEKTGFRLPTEAEWEYACRAGTTGVYAGSGRLDDMGWYYGNAGYDRLSDKTWSNDNLSSNNNKTHPAGQKQANAWGLYDMHGNVWEWCQDWYGDYPAGAVTDPAGAKTGSHRVDRGGCWNSKTPGCRSAARDGSTPILWGAALGFRVVLPVVQLP